MANIDPIYQVSKMSYYKINLVVMGWSGVVDGQISTKKSSSMGNIDPMYQVSGTSYYKIILVVMGGQGWSMDKF